MIKILSRKRRFYIHPKEKVAIVSFGITIFLTMFKTIVGLTTGSLGILSEALHSGMDLIATGVTIVAVRISEKPADDNHHYGHGKIENISALFETLILIVTCGWIVYEAIQRIQKETFEFNISFWSFFIIILSIFIDSNRSRILFKIANEHKSQALEADAFHFSSDLLSSTVVLLGLIFSTFNFHLADSLAALIVSGIILYISLKLSLKAIDELLDKAPKYTKETIEKIISKIPEVEKSHDIRIRTSGAKIFIDLNIHLDPNITLEQAHNISHFVETKIQEKIKNSIVNIHQEPTTEH